MSKKEFIISYDIVTAGIYSVVAETEEEALDLFHAVNEDDLVREANSETACLVSESVSISDSTDLVEEETK